MPVICSIPSVISIADGKSMSPPPLLRGSWFPEVSESRLETEAGDVLSSGWVSDLSDATTLTDGSAQSS